jgi:hypothetical protein
LGANTHENMKSILHLTFIVGVGMLTSCASHHPTHSGTATNPVFGETAEIVVLGDNRPPSVAAEKWIAISDKAGFAVTSDANAPIVVTELYVKTDKGWRRGRVDNPVSAIPLQR